MFLVTACERAESDHQAYERDGHVRDLERALAGFSAVLEVAHNVDIRSAAANGLGTALWSRYERFGDMADLDEAIGLLREALAMYSDENPPAIAAFQANLAGTLRLRWRRTTSVADLTSSIDAIRSAIAATPEHDVRRSARLSNLGDGLLALQVHHNDSSALAEAVHVFRQAAHSAPLGSDDWIFACSNLAEVLRQQHRISSDRVPTILDEAVELARTVVAATPPGGRLQARFQSNLALILLYRFHARGRPVDLAEAADLAHRAVEATPQGHPNRVERSAILAEARRIEFMRVSGLRGLDPRRLVDGSRTDLLDRRATRQEKRLLRELLQDTAAAVAATPREHALRAEALVRRGYALAIKAHVHGDADAQVASLDCYREVTLDSSAPVRLRITAARQLAFGLAMTGGTDWAAASEPFGLAVNLLPQAAPRRVTRRDRERQLAEFTGLACDAAACAIRSNEPERAVQLLEHGRGVLLGQALDLRTELTELHESHPDLARRFEELRSALDRPEGSHFSADTAVSGTPMPTTPLPGEHRHALAAEWDQLLDSVRRLPGFAGFLEPPSVGQLLSAARDHGPIAVMNVSGLRCDALLLFDGAAVTLPLQDLHQPELLRRAEEFRAAVLQARRSDLPSNGRDAAQQTINETLEWLWTAIAEPILGALGLTQQPSEGKPCPRLWWVPTGPLTGLPLHAAGRRDAPGSCVLDRVMSSYAPTVRSLAAAWEAMPRTGDTHDDPPMPLVVALPTTPGQADLPGAAEEAEHLASSLPRSRFLTGEQAVRRTVLDALPQHGWVHFACHAVSTVDGTTANLVLYDHTANPLTIADIARLRLDDAELAYLSACETSIPHENLTDEAVHITGAFQMAGFRHVIGTLWAVDDEVAMAVADNFYSRLLATHATTRSPAEALHNAVRAVRSVHPTAPTLWAPYVHVGA